MQPQPSASNAWGVLNDRRERRRPPPSQVRANAHRWPSAVERRYRALLAARRREIEKLVLERLEAPARSTLDARRMDADADVLIRVVEALKAAVVGGTIAAVGDDAVRALGRQLSLFVDRRVEKTVGRIMLVPQNIVAARTAGDLDAWVREQVRLIKTIDQRYFDDLEELIRESVSEGRRSKELARIIQGRIPQERRGKASAEYNARRIARDQLGSLNAKLTKRRYEVAGVAVYGWLTSNDERVREAHRQQHRQIFRVDGPGARGAGVFGQDIHPGEDIQCRCRMVPLFTAEDVARFAGVSVKRAEELMREAE